MGNVRFQDSLVNSLLDMTPDMMIAGVVLALLFSLATAHLYVLWQKRIRSASSPAALAGVMLVPVLTAMVLCVGFERYRFETSSELPEMFQSLTSGSDPYEDELEHGHWRHFGRRSLTRVFFAQADANHDDRLSPEEAAQFIELVDTDGDGLVDADGLESTVRDRFRAFMHPPDEDEGEDDMAEMEPEPTEEIAEASETEPEPVEILSERGLDRP